MKSSNLKAQASLIFTATLVLTLFASHSAMAKGFKDSKPKQEQTSVGTNGGGGGSVIVCPGQPPVLTDLWEAERSDLKFSGATATQRLNELRMMSAGQVRDALAKNFVDYLAAKSGGDTGARNNLQFMKYLLNEVEKSAFKAVLFPGSVQSFNSAQMQDGPSSFIEVRVDKNARDPRDSGVIKGLSGSGCVEERVAITEHDEGGGIHNKPSITTIRILRPGLYLRMPPLDQYALLIGHEIIHSETSGNVANIEAIGKTKTNSEGVRQLNAWITLGQAKDFEAAESKPKGDRILRCAAVMDESSRKDWLTEYMHFNIYLRANAQDTVVEIENYRNINLWQSVFTRVAAEEKSFLIPKDIDTDINFFSGEVGSSFDFKMDIPNEVVGGALVQMNLGYNYFRDSSGSRKTEFTLQFVQGPNQSVITQVLNSHGQIEFSGQTHCYKNERQLIR